MSIFKRLTKAEAEVREAEIQREIDTIQERLLSRPYVYRPERPGPWSSVSQRRSVAEQYIEALGEEGNEEEVTKKFLRKILRQPGATKERAVGYLENAYRRAVEEGRL